MPETGIGLFPDVGGGWYLSRLPGRVGQYMVLTGARLDGADCHYLQLATHYVEQSAIEELIERIMKAPTRLQGAIGAAATTPPESKMEANLPQIAKLFASDRLEDMLAALEEDESEWAQANSRRSAPRARCRARCRCGCWPKARRGPTSPTRCAPNMRSPAASFEPTISARAFARC